jgi:hypothetical protein
VAAKKATDTIPIVMLNTGDPVGLGLVASLARPGGNVTGLSYSVGLETFGKGLELLKEAVPTTTLICWSPWRMLTHPGRRKAIAPDRTGGLFWTGPSTFLEDDR